MVGFEKGVKGGSFYNWKVINKNIWNCANGVVWKW